MSPLTARRMATPHLARDEARPIANLPELIHKKSRHLEVPFGAGEPKPGTSHNQRPQAADSGIVAMLKVESAPLVSLLLLIATPTIADGIRELDSFFSFFFFFLFFLFFFFFLCFFFFFLFIFFYFFYFVLLLIFIFIFIFFLVRLCF